MPDSVQFPDAITDFLAVYKLSAVIGDFSLSYFKYNDPPRPGALLKRFLSQCSLVILISDPTRGETVLDLSHTGDPTLVISAQITDNFSTSDHVSTLFHISVEIAELSLIEYRNLHKCN